MSGNYTVFETAWGYFALATMDGRLARAVLPCGTRARAVETIHTHLPTAGFEAGLLSDLQAEVVAYFDGRRADFASVPPVALDGLTAFGRRVLTLCMMIRPGFTSTYGDLARWLGRPGAARAVGNALARNPIPLIIPCHRVIATAGGLGGFSAPGGISFKRRLLDHERQFQSR
ncbi:MAG TPA: methylated-DNA--[protein]-cysteine S-methyltransferase [Phycisphaerales bacterium]|nr:methylated-DNA--[protein]-cysteine S-methyltransferase [Phycisphaerales bacterium]